VKHANHNRTYAVNGTADPFRSGRHCASFLACALALALFPALAGAAPEATAARILPVVDAQSKGGVRARLAAVRALRDQTLSAAEIGALWAFLGETPEQANLPMKDLNHLRNDVLHTLVYHSPVLPDVVPRLARMYRDRSRDRTWRDYCIQFLGQAYRRASAPDCALARDVLFEAAAKRTVPTAGTALIALSDNIESPAIDREQVETAALEIAASPKASPGARMTAFQVCAKLGVDEALPHARQAASGETAKSITVRMAATASLGSLGDESDRELLAKLSRSGETRIRRAAAEALRRLGRRTAAPPAR